MAGDWIKYTKDLPGKSEVIAMAEALGVSRFEVVGRLLTVWSWVDSASRSGHVARVTGFYIDELTAPGFALAMRNVRWLEDGENGGIVFPNFDRHISETAKTRALGAKRQRKVRHASVTRTALHKSRAQRDQRREEKSTKNMSTCSLPTAPATRPRDLIWDTVVELFYPDLAPGPEQSATQPTARLARRIGQLTADLKALKATPEEIRRRWALIPSDWTGAGPDALVKHWARLTGKGKPDEFDRLFKGAANA